MKDSYCCVEKEFTVGVSIDADLFNMLPKPVMGKALNAADEKLTTTKHTKILQITKMFSLISKVREMNQDLDRLSHMILRMFVIVYVIYMLENEKRGDETGNARLEPFAIALSFIRVPDFKYA